jgi:protein-disulfide isomerase/uncharacterized membrane protein
MAKARKNIKNQRIEPDQEKHRGQWQGWLVIILAAVGVCISLYLYSLHVALLMGEIKSGPLCGTENGLGCHSVASSPYSSMLGLPLASWGALFYSTLILLGFGGVIFWRDCGRAFFRGTFWLAVLGLAFDLYLAYVMVFWIRTLCALCLTTYVINFLIIITLVKGVWQEPRPRISLGAIFPGTRDAQGIDLYYRNVIKGLLIGCILLASVVSVGGSQFLTKSLTENDRERLSRIKKNLSGQKPKAIDVKNRPFKGSDDAAVTVVEFSDFLCPFCSKAAKYLKIAQAGNRSTARFVFRHFPLDKSCNRRLSSDLHPGACLLAEGSVCANEQDKFWQYHDIAFETKNKISRSTVMDIASKIGLDLNEFKSCLDSGKGLEVVGEDIKAAFRAGVKSTPTLFINGRLLRGVPKPLELNQILQYSKNHLAPPK